MLFTVHQTSLTILQVNNFNWTFPTEPDAKRAKLETESGTSPVKPILPVITGNPVEPILPVVTGNPVEPILPVKTGNPVEPILPVVTGTIRVYSNPESGDKMVLDMTYESGSMGKCAIVELSQFFKNRLNAENVLSNADWNIKIFMNIPHVGGY